MIIYDYFIYRVSIYQDRLIGTFYYPHLYFSCFISNFFNLFSILFCSVWLLLIVFAPEDAFFIIYRQNSPLRTFNYYVFILTSFLSFILSWLRQRKFGVKFWYWVEISTLLKFSISFYFFVFLNQSLSFYRLMFGVFLILGEGFIFFIRKKFFSSFYLP